MALYIGLMSGTSMDGIDAALVELDDLDGPSCSVIEARDARYPDELRKALIGFSQDPAALSVDELGRLDRAVGECFRDAAIELLALSNTTSEAVAGIGSHGQTLRHKPRGKYPFSIQIGDPNVIASGTGITTVADFRRRDLALGGEGAPLAPAFHNWLFATPDCTRVILNLGGIANITILTPDGIPATGFDTGPGNGLMDAWIRHTRGKPFDDGGAWAATGRVDASLLDRLLADDYFAEAPPKSTGFEHFNLDWIHKHGVGDIDAADVQATLLALTVSAVNDAIAIHAAGAGEVLVCGGGSRNDRLMAQLATRLAPVSVKSTSELGLDPEWVEAAAFAWLASRTLSGLPGNLPSVTGASGPAILGGIYPGDPG